MSRGAEREITLNELHHQNHDTADNAWLAIDGIVYDITSFLKKHPGGQSVLLSVAGTDCTEAFHGYHPDWVAEKHLQKNSAMRIGRLKGYKPTKMRQEYLELEQDMRRAGLWQTPVHHYVWYFTYCFSMFAGSVACVLWNSGGSQLVYFLGAVLMGMFWQQLSFSGHDFGHNSVTPRSWTDYLGGLVVCTFYGVSAQWWKATHNVHHVVTNSKHYDCDVQYIPVFAVNNQLLTSFFSHYHQRIFEFGKFARLLLSVQHILFFPIMMLARFNLYIQSIVFLLATPSWNLPGRQRLSALAATALFLSWYGALVWRLPDAATIWMFLLVSHAVCGIIHLQIVLSHFAMPTYDGRGIQHTDPDHFVKLQLAGSMNVDCHPLLDWFHGGLQFQNEHHLFPRLPRYNLRRASDEFIKPFLMRHGVGHVEMPFLDAILYVLRQLRSTALEAWSLSDEEVARRSVLKALANAEG